MIRAIRGALLAALALAATLAGADLAAAQPAPGKRALARYGCTSCHDVGLARGEASEGCVGCHQRVARAPRTGLGRAPRVEHFLDAPDLRHVARRLRADYLVRYLQDPHDARPRLEETMPRLPVTDEDARAIVSYLARIAGEGDVPRTPPPSEANVARGREVFARAGCPTCHERGNEDFGVRLPPAALAPAGRATIDAPNLRFVRERVDPDVALAWILDPRSVDPNAEMPDLDLTPEDALAVRDYLYLADAGAPVAAPTAPTLETLAAAPAARRVRYADVRPIFERSCIHCHAHTDARAASAFGFAPSSLDLSSAEGVRAGVLLPDGARRSILAPDATGVPPLLARLLRRHEEAARDVVAPRRDTMEAAMRERRDEPPGMPLGLPPVPVEELRVLAAWIARGAPR